MTEKQLDQLQKYLQEHCEPSKCGYSCDHIQQAAAIYNIDEEDL